MDESKAPPQPPSPPYPKFRPFDRNDLESGLLQMNASPHRYPEELRSEVRSELIYRIENGEYEQACRGAKALTGGYDLAD